MSDTPKQLNLDGNDSFESALGERLLKRATEPLGVIDVRWAEEKYFRIIRWLGRCTALVDHLSRRYGVEETSAYVDRPFAIQRGGPANVSNTIQTFLSAGLLPGSLPGAESQTKTLQSSQQEAWRDARPSSLADILAERSANPYVQPSSSSEGTFRISRRPPPRLVESDAAQISPRPRATTPTATPMEEAKGDTVVERSAPITHQMPDLAFRNKFGENKQAKPNAPSVTPTTRSERDGATSSTVQRDVPATTSGQERAGATSSPVQRDVPAATKAQERPEGTPVRNRNEDADASRVHSLPLVTPTIVRSAMGRLPSLGMEAARGLRPDEVIAQDGSRSRTSSVPSMTEAFETRGESSSAEAPEMVLLRGDRENADASQLSSLPRSLQASRGVSSAGVASEIPGESVSAERLNLVWREQQVASRADGRTRETRSVASSGGAQSGQNEFAPNEFGTGEFPSVEPSPFTKPDARNDSPPGYQAQSRELQVEDISPRVIRSISERVMRAITLDLKLERERRGVTKWR